MATTGVVGQRWRATVTAAGVVEPHDGTASLGWYVAADDRWHDPQTDSGVRHRRVDGTAVLETKVRIPGGDAVQRVWSVADAGGHTLVTVHNDSPSPIAVAFTRGDLATDRLAADVPIEGISLPPGAVVFPVGHRATITVGLTHARRGPSPLPRGLPTADAVVRGWITRTDVASRLDVPDHALVEAVRASRCELLLNGLADIATEPQRHLVGIAELIRLGDLGDPDSVDVVPSVATAVAAVLRRRRRLGPAALDAAAVDAAAVVFGAAGERRALADLARLRRTLTEDVAVGEVPSGVPDCVPGDVAAIPAVERLLAAGPTLFPGGIPERWHGRDLEAHRLVVGAASRLSLAIRWHGANAAVLWKVDGEPLTLSATIGTAQWASTQPQGEALWRLSELDGS